MIGVRFCCRRFGAVAMTVALVSTLGLGATASAARSHPRPARARAVNDRGNLRGHEQWDRDAPAATALRVDTFTDPIGLGDGSPSLSWRLAGRRSGAVAQVA